MYFQGCWQQAFYICALLTHYRCMKLFSLSASNFYHIIHIEPPYLTTQRKHYWKVDNTKLISLCRSLCCYIKASLWSFRPLHYGAVFWYLGPCVVYLVHALPDDTALPMVSRISTYLQVAVTHPDLQQHASKGREKEDCWQVNTDLKSAGFKIPKDLQLTLQMFCEEKN